MMPRKSLALLPAALFWLTFTPTSTHAAPPISYAGGDGSSVEKAVVIKGGNEETGVRAEYAYLERHYPGYHRGGQGVFKKRKHAYDVLDFTTADGAAKKVYFDITGFYGKLD